MDKILELIEDVKENIDSNSYNEICKELMRLREGSYSKISFLKFNLVNETLPTDEMNLQFKLVHEPDNRIVKNNNMDSFLSVGDNIEFMGGVKACSDIAGNLDQHIFKFQCCECQSDVNCIIRIPRQVFISKKEYN